MWAMLVVYILLINPQHGCGGKHKETWTHKHPYIKNIYIYIYELGNISMYFILFLGSGFVLWMRSSCENSEIQYAQVTFHRLFSNYTYVRVLIYA